MAKVPRAVQHPGAKGAEPTQFTGLNSADTQVIPNKNGDVLLRVNNGGSEPTSVTIVTPGEVDGNAVADLVVAVAAGKEKVLGPFDPAIYNEEEGNLQVSFTKVTSLKLEAVKVAH